LQYDYASWPEAPDWRLVIAIVIARGDINKNRPFSGNGRCRKLRLNRTSLNEARLKTIR